MKISYELLGVDLKVIEDLDRIFKTIIFFVIFANKEKSTIFAME